MGPVSDEPPGPPAPPPDPLQLFEQLLARLGVRLRPLPVPPPFPPPAEADPQGCVARGGELTPELVLEAYRAGIFPMAEPDGLRWWSPDPRTVLDLEALHVPRRLQRTLRQGRFEVAVDRAPAEVVAGCAEREDTWISPEIAAVYLELHRRGHVHTVETWREGRLVGGLYGVALGGAFMAESMFHRETDASKVAVVGLVERLRARGFALLDIQYRTRATSVFAPVALPRAVYLERLQAALALGPRWE